MYYGLPIILISFYDEEEHLVYSALDPVLYVGDNEPKVYRYTEKNKSDNLGSFI